MRATCDIFCIYFNKLHSELHICILVFNHCAWTEQSPAAGQRRGMDFSGVMLAVRRLSASNIVLIGGSEINMQNNGLGNTRVNPTPQFTPLTRRHAECYAQTKEIEREVILSLRETKVQAAALRKSKLQAAAG
jgi:hypothetical protein